MLDDQPFITVVIPCFKQAHFLSEAIESVLGQTYRNFEIVVVDDGSPDDVPGVALRYPQVRYIRQKNQGLSAARNTGIRESKGEMVMFLDADDYLLPRALQSGVEAFQECPESSFVYGRYYCMKEDGTRNPHPSEQRLGPDLYESLLKINCIGMVSVVLYRRELFDRVGGFDPDISPAADYDLYLRIARDYRSHRHHEIVASYRLYEVSMSKDFAVMLQAVIKGLKRQKKRISDDTRLLRAYQEGLAFWREYYGEPLYLRFAKNFMKKDPLSRSIRDLYYLLRYYPQVINIHGQSRLNKFRAKLTGSRQI